MSSIQTFLNRIKTAIYGGEVRDSIHDSIKQCYEDVTAGKTIAETAARSANNAATNASNAATSANNARDAANTAATAANAAALSAESKAETARNAATSANNARDAANAAALSIEEMTVTFEDVGPDMPGSADISNADGRKQIHFKLRQGKTGAPYVIKGDAYESLNALEIDISSPQIGDQYNVGTEPPYNVYRWTGTRWENQGKVVDNISSMTEGDVDAISSGTETEEGQRYMSKSIFAYFYNHIIKPIADNYVVKEEGKGLSKNDFTDELKEKLDGCAEKAKYRMIPFLIAPSAWVKPENVNTYRYIIYDEAITSKTFCIFDFDSTSNAATSTLTHARANINWYSENGYLILTTAKLPVDTLSGKVTCMEVNYDK